MKRIVVRTFFCLAPLAPAACGSSTGDRALSGAGIGAGVSSATTKFALSQRRADRVRDALIAAGVSAHRIDTRWTGEGKQAIATADQIAEQRNRVVDVTVVQDAR